MLRLLGTPPAASSEMSADYLMQVALNDPERYMELKAHGHSLPKLDYGPDRR